MVQTLGADVPARRGRRVRRPRRAQPASAPVEIPLTRFTVIGAQPSHPEEAAAELKRMQADSEAAEAAVSEGLHSLNRMLRAHRVATADPHGHEISREAAAVARIGHGGGGVLADGRWDDAVELAPPERRRRRAEALRPEERLAEILAGRERIDACEVLLLRARADLDQGYLREAALQLRAGLDALLAELPGRAGPEQEEDLGALDRRRDAVAQAAEQALRGSSPPDGVEAVAQTLAICERVLRRRQVLK